MTLLVTPMARCTTRTGKRPSRLRRRFTIPASCLSRQGWRLWVLAGELVEAWHSIGSDLSVVTLPSSCNVSKHYSCAVREGEGNLGLLTEWELGLATAPIGYV